ncbi:MAG: putative toxin-antitoxin system toxin component, PIN family [Burkholderiales bacterium]|jgi:putative PIN family toxin of toxin-antitoxin system|nr:putative toxin-antitoxin system toxin component, PIN family [Burkholderiales bacterium]
MAEPQGTAKAIVIDTNVVLDLFVFDDPAAGVLRDALGSGQLAWLATAAMRDELARVLAYPQIARRLAHRALAVDAVLAQFDRGARVVETAARAPFVCKDADDQKFIDLAVAHRALLLSKDAAVLCMRRRLATLGVTLSAAWGAPRHDPMLRNAAASRAPD